MTTNRQSSRRSWTGAREHRRLSIELADAEGDEFAPRVSLLLSALWPRARVRTLEGGTLQIEDTENDAPRRRIVHCIGFHQAELDIGPGEAQDACTAIDRFEQEGREVDSYLVVHNRDGRSATFRKSVQARLEALEGCGRVRNAELWDRKRLLQEAFNAMLVQVLDILSEQSRTHAEAALPALSLEAVALRTSFLRADQYQLKTQLQEPLEIADPARRIFSEEDLSLVLGEFGTGKTTAVQRAIQGGTLRPIYVPGAVISSQVISTKDLLDRCFQHEGLFAERPEKVREISHLLARPVLEYLLKDPTLPVVLILDGIDESPVLTRRGGFQQLFNMLHSVKIPVVLTMRSELWHREKEAFAAVYGKPSKTQPRREQQIRLIELLPWKPDQIRALIDRHRQHAETPKERTRLEALADLAARGRLGDLYGDLPERPLFLCLILESVVAEGLPGERIGRARLLRDWTRFKILRDIHEPMRVGGEGRIPLLEGAEGTQTTLELAWEAMVGAAANMLQLHDGALELTGDCALEKVRCFSPRLERLQEPLGLFLNSLLLGLPHSPGADVRVRFAHRSFQEFFLAWALLTHEELLEEGSPPDSVRAWMRQIVEEGLLDPHSGDGVGAATPRASDDGRVGPLQAAPAPEIPPPHPDLVIRVIEERKEGTLRLNFRLDSVDGKAGFRSRSFRGKALRAEPEQYRDRLLETIEQFQRRAKHPGDNAGRNPLESLGQELYEELFPPALRDAYRTFHKKIETLLLVSEEPWIPWELVKPYDDSDPEDPVDDDFLCMEFQMTRWLREAPAPPEAIAVRRLACFATTTRLDGKPLPNAAAELGWLEALARRRGLVDRSLVDASHSRVLARLEDGGLGLVHFVGHGWLDRRAPNEPTFDLADGSALRPRDLMGSVQTAIKPEKPLFFLNACHVGRQGWSLTGLGGWASRCVQGCHCGAFIAPQWAVPDRLAHAFATRFYEALEEGASFGRAAREARKWVRKVDRSLPAWLAYVVYAHPLGHLQVADAREEPPENEL